MVEAIHREIISEKGYLEGEKLSSIYFGGGTPSILKSTRINLLLSAIREHYSLESHIEVTLEANPEDLNPSFLAELREIGINRLSIGIQSFHDDDLRFLNRRHDAWQAKSCLEMAIMEGFENLNVDLIYGVPGMSREKWEDNLATAFYFLPPHLSAYHLTYESGTVLDYRRRKKRIRPVDEQLSLVHYRLLTDRMEGQGYEHYEISNFARQGSFSRHNSSYWKGEKYLGVGPSAHSYNGQSRRWNMSRNTSYIRGIQKGMRVYDEELLTPITRFHDYLMTGLRTMWGIDLMYVKSEWGDEHYKRILNKSESFIRAGNMLEAEGKLILTRDGMFIADHIIGELFL
jgi:oxygen-independent coproporphyrinogen-3 oxidase